MPSFESGGFDFWPAPEADRWPDKSEREPINAHDESEVQRSHERADVDKIDAQLAQLREQLSEDVDGSTDFRQACRLRRGFDRRASLLGVAQIN